jgi:hypothetical protein
LASGT